MTPNYRFFKDCMNETDLKLCVVFLYRHHNRINFIWKKLMSPYFIIQYLLACFIHDVVVYPYLESLSALRNKLLSAFSTKSYVTIFLSTRNYVTIFLSKITNRSPNMTNKLKEMDSYL